jgi:hypothetical protein
MADLDRQRQSATVGSEDISALGNDITALVDEIEALCTEGRELTCGIAQRLSGLCARAERLFETDQARDGSKADTSCY